MKKIFSTEILPGILFFVLGSFFLAVTPEQVPTTETSRFTAQTFPYVLLGIIMMLSAVLIISGIVKTVMLKKAGKKDDMLKKGNMPMLAAIVLLVTAAVLLGKYTGLLVAGLLLVYGFLVLYRVKKPLHYAIVTAVVVGFYFLFKFAFGLNLP